MTILSCTLWTVAVIVYLFVGIAVTHFFKYEVEDEMETSPALRIIMRIAVLLFWPLGLLAANLCFSYMVLNDSIRSAVPVVVKAAKWLYNLVFKNE